MTLEQLQARPDFVMLGPQQKDWVTAYCTNGADKIAATEKAYASNDSKSALAIANRNLRHPAIKRLVDDFYGQVDETGTKDEFLSLLWKKVRGTTDDKTQLGWATLYMKVKGYETEKAPAEPPQTVSEDWVSRLNAVKGD